MTARRRAATDPSVHQQVLDESYVVVDLLDRSEVDAIREALRAFDLDTDHEFFASPYHAHGPSARTFDLAVKRLVAKPIDAVAPQHTAFMVAVTSKGKRRGAAIKFHHDWTYTDERVDRPIFFWCPLVDTSPRNGGLAVVPGSHRWTSGIRPSRAVEATEHLQDRFAPLAVDLEVRAGQAVAFDPALLHGSGPNPTSRGRPAVTVACVREGAQLLHFHEDADGNLHGARVNDAFFTEHPYRTAPTGYPPFAPWTVAVTEQDFVSALDGVAVSPS